MGSTALKKRLGDAAGAAALAAHDALFRSCLAEHGGREQDHAGDGFFATFPVPSAALRCALQFLEGLEQLEVDEPLRARVGIHLGEIVRLEDDAGSSTGGRPVGLAVDTAARVMGLACGGQILLTLGAFDSARQQLLSGPDGQKLQWLAHGPYLFAGLDEPLDVFEVGFPGLAPLVPPPDSEKGRRVLGPGGELTLGWRPAAGRTIPGRSHWVLETQTGGGGFGEVWIAAHEKTASRRVFKFCFEADRVRSLRREVVLFRLLKESLGQRDDISQILDWEFDRPPYFLETEYSEGGDLAEWAQSRGGLEAIPLADRLEIVAQTAVALGAAHSVGVLHKDIKPANILMRDGSEGGRPRAVLTDFGIGLVTDRQVLAERGITVAGLTQTLLSSTGSSGGTPMYLAPELVEGKPATTASDLYALGAMFYQLVIGDVRRVLAPGWERDIEDELLREDIAACVAGRPEERLAGANELARRLGHLGERREQRAAEHALREKAGRYESRRRQFVLASVVGVALTLVAGLFAWRESSRAREEARLRAQAVEARAQEEDGRYVTDIQLASVHLESGSRGPARILLEENPARHRHWEWGYLADRAGLGRPKSRAATPELRTGKTAAERWRGAVPTVVATLDGHEPPFLQTQLLFTSDGRTLISAINSGPARVWDLESGQMRLELSEPETVGGLALSHGDRFVLAIPGLYEYFLQRASRAVLWDLEQGAPVQRFGTEGGVLRAWFSPDDSLAVLASWRHTLEVWEVPTGEYRLRIPAPPDPNPYPIADLHFLNGGHLLVPWGWQKLVSWDLETREIVEQVTVPTNPDRFLLALSPDAGRVVTYTRDWEPGSIRDARSGEKLEELAPAVRDVSFTEDGTLTAYRQQDGTLILREHPTGDELVRVPGLLRTAMGVWSDNAVFFNADGSRLAYVDGDDGTIQILAPGESSGERLEGHTDLIRDARWSSDGSLLAGASLDHTATVWEVASRQRKVTLAGHDGVVFWVDISPDGRSVLTYSFDGTHILWDATTGERRFPAIRSHDPSPRGRDTLRWQIASLNGRRRFTPDGSRFAIASAGNVEVRDTETGETIAILPGGGGVIAHTQFSPIGERLLTLAAGSGRIHLWDPQTGVLLRTLVADYEIHYVEFSPDGSRIAGGSASSGVRWLWDTETGSALLQFQAHELGDGVVRFSPDGEQLLTSSLDRTAKLWDANTGELLTIFCCHKSNGLRDAIFHPDGTRILTITVPEELKLWDLDGNELLTLDAPGLYQASWSPDGSLIAGSFSDGTVKLWKAVPWQQGTDELESGTARP